MQQYVSNGTVGSKLARANMKPANPRARPRNLETVTAARGGLAGWPALLPLPFASGFCATVLSLEALRGDRWGTPRPRCLVLVRGTPLARSGPDSTPLPMSTSRRRVSLLWSNMPMCASRARTSDGVAFPSAWVSLPSDVGMTSHFLSLVEM